MAYLDAREAIDLSDNEKFKDDIVAPTPVADFKPHEWDVIALAQKDGLPSVNAPGRFDRLLSFLFGFRLNPNLADPKLEALRRLAVFAWHQGYAVPVSAIKAVKEKGYSREQIELLFSKIAAHRIIGRPHRVA